MEEQKKTTEKLSDKAFSRLLWTSVLAILLCIVCLCSSTFAWFIKSVPSVGNAIKTGTCSLTVTLYKDGVEEALTDGAVLLEKDATYTVTLTLPAESASGYALITAGGVKYYTEHLLGNAPAEQTLSFTLTVEETQSVTLESRWGIYSGVPAVEASGALHLPATE